MGGLCTSNAVSQTQIKRLSKDQKLASSHYSVIGNDDEKFAEAQFVEKQRSASKDRDGSTHSQGNNHDATLQKSDRKSLLLKIKASGSSSGSGVNLKNRTNRLASADLSSLGRKVFCDFLIKCMAMEVLQFWDMTSEFVANCSKKVVSEAAYNIANKMMQEFIVPEAPQRMDLGYTIDGPLLEAYCLGTYSIDQFDPARRSLWKLLKGLQMDACMTFGVKSHTAQAVAKFLESEERKMHQLTFQRDVNPLIRMLRRKS